MSEFQIGLIFLWILISISKPSEFSNRTLCDQFWTYHSQTHSCMRILHSPTKSWIAANMECMKYEGGFYKNTTGHLVYIFNQETDNFVKDLLASAGIDFAMIGLHDRVMNGLYCWGEVYESMTYSAWKDNPHIPDFDKSCVVITRNGWEEYEYTGNDSFICQVDAVVLEPEMTCPVTDEGKGSAGIECKINVPHQFKLVGVRYHRAGAYVTHCTSHKCGTSSLYKTSIMVKDIGGITKISSSLKLMKVKVQRNNTWSCSVSLKDVPRPLTGQCELMVYTLPDEIVCSSKFTETQLQVTCKAGKVYPSAFCMWEVSNESMSENLGTGETPETDSVPGSNYYQTNCKIQYPVTRAGLYRFKVAWYPDMSGLPESQNSTVKTVVYDVSVEPPPGLPAFVSSRNSPVPSTLEVEENKTVALACQVPGGNPPVYRTTISCPDMLEKSEFGQTASLELKVTQDINNHSCKCRASHIVGYTKTASVTFLVKSTRTSDNKGRFVLNISVSVSIIVGLVVILLVAGCLVKRRGKCVQERQSNSQADIEMTRQSESDNTGHHWLPGADGEDDVGYLNPVPPDYTTNIELSAMPQPRSSGDCGRQGGEQEDLNINYRIIPTLAGRPEASRSINVDNSCFNYQATSEPAAKRDKRRLKHDSLPATPVKTHPDSVQEEEVHYETVDW